MGDELHSEPLGEIEDDYQIIGLVPVNMCGGCGAALPRRRPRCIFCGHGPAPAPDTQDDGGIT